MDSKLEKPCGLTCSFRQISVKFEENLLKWSKEGGKDID